MLEGYKLVKTNKQKTKTKQKTNVIAALFIIALNRKNPNVYQ